MKTKNQWMKTAVCFCLAVLMVVGCVTSVEAAPRFTFSYKGVTIAPGDKAANFIKKAGKASVTKKNSCATKGYDYTYKYQGFTLKTYTLDKKKNSEEYVNSIVITSSKVRTPEGLTVGSKEADIKKKYKNAKDEFGIGSYTQQKGKTKINITVKKGRVIEIQILGK